MAVKQTAGRRDLGEFAPKFAQLNDDVLFGEVWSREDKLSLRDRSIVTVVALLSQGLTDSSFQYHLMTAKKNGILRWLAKSMGCFPYGKGNLDGRNRRLRKGRTRKFDGISYRKSE